MNGNKGYSFFDPSKRSTPISLPSPIEENNKKEAKVTADQYPNRQPIRVSSAKQVVPLTKPLIALNPNSNLMRQKPAGVVYVTPEQPKKYIPKETKRKFYYEEEDEEVAEAKKIYKNDYKLRNYYCCNCCKGRFARCCPFCNCCEWFYGCPVWCYCLLLFTFLAVFVTFWVLFAYVMSAKKQATVVTVTRIYNRTWGLVWQNCNPSGIGPACTTYSSTKITEGYNFAPSLHSTVTNELLILSLFILALLFQFY